MVGRLRERRRRAIVPLGFVMKRSIGFLVVCAACAGEKRGDEAGADGATSSVSVGEGSGDGSADDGSGNADNAEAPDDGPDDAPDDAPDDGPDDDGMPPATKFDLGDGNAFCEFQEAGIFCNDNTAVLCDGAGGTEDTTVCTPEVCVPGQGCVQCLAGQHSCCGEQVLECDTSGAVAQWATVETCDPAAQQFCNAGLGTCAPLSPIGGTEPTGEYYQYGIYDLSPDGYSQVSDVDSLDNRIWFVGMGPLGLTIGAYDVELIDSDGDGQLEPNQHPDYPDEQGPVEERVFTFVEEFGVTNGGAYPNTMELYATPTSIIYSGPTAITERIHATGATSTLVDAPPWLSATPFQSLSFLGYDELNEVWYSGNEMARRVFQHCAATDTWGYSFEYPLLAGGHMDGIEVVVDQSTATPFMYVSDMTSNFIGQYRHDPNMGWVQENLFSYNESMGAAVEGFGYGALNHFWVGSLANTFYELGGGDLTEFLDPEG